MSTEAPTIEALADRVRETMEDLDVSFEAAVAGVCEEIAGNGDLRETWRTLGRDLLARALAPRFRRSGGPKGAQIRRPSRAPAKNPSWRHAIRGDPEAAFGIELPVGATRKVKPIGEFTRSDVRAIEEFYDVRVQQMRARREYWGRIKRLMEPTDTLRSAYEEGRIKRDDLSFFLRSGRDLAGELLEDGEVHE